MKKLFDSASVKVMRSFDYCHFEICLGVDGGSFSPDDVDEVRKEAARLADKAVEQYKIAKAAAEAREEAFRDYQYAKRRADRIREVAESDRSESEKADLKAFEDKEWNARRFDYGYEDDLDDGFWED